MKPIILILIFLLSNSLAFADREVILADFENDIFLDSYPEEDLEPSGWNLDTETTYNFSTQSLHLFGNSWKILQIEPTIIDSGDVWQVAVYCDNVSNIQSFGISDGTNELKYSFWGSNELDIESWIPHYQGNFSGDSWHLFQLPVADDWFAWYDYYPTIDELIFINDSDSNGGNVYFDEVSNITEDLLDAPDVEISYQLGNFYQRNQQRYVTVNFSCNVIDEDSEEFSYHWQFGDANSDTLETPSHSYNIEDDHDYTVLLEVRDESENYGYAVCEIEIDEGESQLPLKVNFVGDIMIGRNYENSGGIIDQFGVEAIFEPTLDIFGNVADISVANLEVPFTTHNVHHPTKSVYFKANPENAYGLIYAGIDLVTLANNHILDYMEPGIAETLQTLDNIGLKYSGAGQNSYEAYQPIYYNRKGINIAFLASCDRTGQYNNAQPYLQAAYNKAGFAYQTPYYIQKQIADVQDNADLIVIESHSGSEYSSGPGSHYDSYNFTIPGHHDEEYSPFIDIPHMWDVEVRHFMIDAGADLVICHHPHIIQGFEIYRKKLIAHSLGNFVFDLSYPETMPTMVLNTEIGLEGFSKFTVTPAFIDNYIPQPAIGDLGFYILKDLAQKSKALNTYLDIDNETMTANIIIDTLEMVTNTTILSQNFELNAQDDYYQSNALELSQDGYISGVSRIYPNSGWEGRVGDEIVWFGNAEDEGCTEWNINSNNEWYDEETFYEGFQSICIRLFSNAGDNYITNFSHRIRIDEDKEHSLHGYIKTLNGADASIEVKYYSSRTSSNELGMEDIGSRVFGDTSWIYYEKSLNIPEGTNFIDIRLTNSFPENGEGFAWFDNVGIVRWEEWKSLSELHEISNPNNYVNIQLRNSFYSENNIVEYLSTNYHATPPVFFETDELQLADCSLHNYPNPFNPSAAGRSPATTIKFSAPKSIKNLNLNIFNVKGQKVKTIRCEQFDNVWQNVIWNGKDSYNKKVATGIYFYQLQGKNFYSKPHKMLLLK